VILCIYDMAREAPRTILSAAAPYQRDVDPADYEVIVVDNGSPEPLPAAVVDALPPSVRLVHMPDATPSPAHAMNWAASQAQGDVLLFAVDGARIFSDRLYATALEAHALVDDAIAYTMSFHLGPKVQMLSTQEGYDQAAEDELIAGSGWPERPAAIFDISVFAGSSSFGYFAPIPESNAFTVPRALFERLGGYDERYRSPGGGLCNLELFGRYATRPGARNVCLLSEGTFHQVHGGIATSGKMNWDDFGAEHRSIFGQDYQQPTYESLYYGRLRPETRRYLDESVTVASPERMI
jgi:hypothetical protein